MSFAHEYATLRKALLGKHYKRGAAVIVFHLNLGKKLLDLFCYLDYTKDNSVDAFKSVLRKACERHLDWKTCYIHIPDVNYIGDDPEMALVDLNKRMIFNLMGSINKVFNKSKSKEIEEALLSEFKHFGRQSQLIAQEIIDRFTINDISPFYKEALIHNPSLAKYILEERAEELQKYINLA